MKLFPVEKSQKPMSFPVIINDYSYWKKFGNLIQSITITALDVFFLLGSIFSSIPKILTNVAFNILNFSGFLSWSFYVDQTKKNMEDICFSIKKNNCLMIVASFLRTIFVITSIVLIAFNCCAAAALLINCSSVTQSIYSFIRPFGVPCLVTSIVLDVIYYYIAKKTLDFKIKKEDLSQFFQCFFQTNHSKKQLDSYASYVHGCIDKDTWKHFMKHLPYADKTKQEELYNRVLIPNIETQQTIAVSNLFLRLLGEIGMYLSIVYPRTILQAACWTILSSLYTGQLVYQHYNQYKHRKLTSSIILPHGSLVTKKNV